MTRTSPMPKLLFLAALCLAMYTAYLCVIPASSIDSAIVSLQSAYAEPSPHAVDKHADEPSLIRQCLDDYGPEAVLYNKSTNRNALCVFVTLLNRWGLWIEEADTEQNVTAYVKTKFNRLDQVIKYLNNVGYE